MIESTLYDDNMLVAIRYGTWNSLNRARSGCEELQVPLQVEREPVGETGLTLVCCGIFQHEEQLDPIRCYSHIACDTSNIANKANSVSDTLQLGSIIKDTLYAVHNP